MKHAAGLLCIALLLLPAAAHGQGTTRMRIAVLGSVDASAEPYFGQATGIFRKYGLDAEISAYNGGGAVVAAVAGGALDAGFSNITSAVAAIQNGIPIVVLTPADIAYADHESTMLVKVRGSRLRTGADLNGKIVAVTTLGGTLQLGAETWIDKNAGDSRTVHFVEVPTSSMTPALKAGRIDAAMLSEPLLTQAKADVEVLGNAFAAIAPAWSAAVFVASKAWVSANPDAARRFVAAMRETARWANTHHAETARMFAPQAGIDPAVLAATPRANYGDTLTRALLQPPIDVAVKYGALKEPFDARDIVTAAEPYTR
jgi:NitT/TauT family transport system substrate-binding protein